MELYAKGQLSFLILTCLQERDFYGLDIITDIYTRSNARINLKKPSVYSNLTRMEKQGYISSYLQSSDFGPNRKYYSLTEKGRGFYQELKTYFERNNIDVFKDFIDNDEDIIVNSPTLENKNNAPANQNFVDKQEDFFDFSSLEKNNEETNVANANNQQEIIATINNNDDHKEDKLENESLIQTEHNINEKIDDAVFLSNNDIDEYNKRLYDISKDINKMKRKRSFAEDQIAMTATVPLFESNEKKKANIEEFKTSLLETKTKFQDERLSSDAFARTLNLSKSENKENSIPYTNSQKNEKYEKIDDAKYITETIDASKVEHARKITPPRLKIISENTKDNRLPAPKRDKSIDPSHREILNKLYSRTKDNNPNEVRADAIYDYSDLKDFYEEQNISFNIYEKSLEKNKHNTNFLYLILSSISFLLISICSLSLYFLNQYLGLTYYATNFLYVLLPCLFIFDVLHKFYNFKQYAGWTPSQILSQWKILLIYFFASGTIIALNFACGMTSTNFSFYATTLILPLLTILVMVPIRYYLKRFILVKFWK